MEQKQGLRRGWLRRFSDNQVRGSKERYNKSFVTLDRTCGIAIFSPPVVASAPFGAARKRVACGAFMSVDRIHIRMEAYDHRSLDASAKEIVEHAKRTNARVCGPIPMPTRIERYTVLRSPHIDKKSREQFEMRTHKRVIDIFDYTARTIEALNRLVVPAGVFVKIKA
jgi:small subunit ribosomal protein S10